MVRIHDASFLSLFQEKYLLRDHSICHYLYDDVNGMSLEALEHSNLEEAK